MKSDDPKREDVRTVANECLSPLYALVNEQVNACITRLHDHRPPLQYSDALPEDLLPATTLREKIREYYSKEHPINTPVRAPETPVEASDYGDVSELEERIRRANDCFSVYASLLQLNAQVGLLIEKFRESSSRISMESAVRMKELCRY